MKVLVTGASGLLGANVVELLLSCGYEVSILIRRSSNTLGLKGLTPEVHYGDLKDKESIIHAARHCNAIIHCAANTNQWKTTRMEHDHINLDGTKHTLEAAKTAGVGKVIFVSTANTFPLSNNQPLILDTDYVRSKQAAEDYVLSQDQVPAVIINPSFMIGPRDVKPSSGQAVLHFVNHNPVFTPAGGKSFVHVKDVAEAILKNLESSVEGKRFLVANDNRSYKSFFNLIGEVTGHKKRIIVIPPAISQLAGEIGTIIGKLTGSMPKLTKENAAIINTNLFYNGEDTYHELGIKKRPLEEAIREAVDWFRKNKYC
ncbi:MAG: NAD-dependent epimerase/dehydratase family protein [Anditalea sp.]